MVAGVQAHRAEWIGDDGDLLAVGAQRDDGPLAVEALLQHDHVALDLVPRRRDDVERLVQDQLLSRPQRLGLDGRVQPDLDLAALREDVDGVVFTGREVHAVGRRRCAELVDLLPQRRDFFARLAECLQQPLALPEVLRDRVARRAKVVFEHVDLQRLHGRAPQGVRATSRVSTRNSMDGSGTSSGMAAGTTPR